MGGERVNRQRAARKYLVSGMAGVEQANNKSEAHGRPMVIGE
jgi:hypothetical protein